MKIVKSGENQLEVLRGVSFDGISCPLYVKHTTAATAWSSAIHTLENCQAKATLFRDGQEPIVLFNDNLKNLVVLSHLESPIYEYVATTTKVIDLVTQTTGVKGEAYIPFSIKLGSTINLKGNDYVEVEFTVNSNFFGSQVDTSVSYLQFDVEESIGLEVVTPVLRSLSIQASSTNPSFSLGDNVTRIILANYDKTDCTQTNQVVNTLFLSCDKWKRADNYNEMLAKKRYIYANDADAVIRDQNFLIFNADAGVELDSVKMDLSTQAANVTAAKNYVLYRSFVVKANTVARAKALESKHIAQASLKTRLR